MKNILKFSALSLAISISTASFAAAQSPSALYLYKIYKLLYNSISTNIKTTAALTYETPEDIGSMIQNNISQSVLGINSSTLGKSLTLATVQNILNPRGKNLTNALYVTAFSGANANINRSSDIMVAPTHSMPIFGSATPAQQSYAGNMNFSLNTLLTPSLYQGTQEQSAEEFIQYATELYKPTAGLTFPNNFPFNNNKKLQLLQNNTAYKKYMMTVRSTVAQESVALSNMNYLLSERLEQKTGAQKTSSRQQEQLAITDEYGNPKWYKAMAKASPATIARATLYTMAGVRYQLYQNYKLMERMLATLSMIELADIRSSQVTTIIQKTAAQRVIDNIAQNGSVNGTPNMLPGDLSAISRAKSELTPAQEKEFESHMTRQQREQFEQQTNNNR